MIVPVFNVEAYLERCLDSLRLQTLRNIEIILIDDGSIDGTADICDRYASADERIKVIHKNNEGISAARNDGVDMALADYIMFVDGDDWVEPEFCEIPYRLAVDHGADLVMFEINQYRYKDMETVNLPKIHIEEGYVTKQCAMDYICASRWSSWSKFYSRKLFDTIRFPEGKTYEDMGTTHKIVHAANCIYLSHAKLYNNVMIRPNSITNTNSQKNLHDRIEMNMRRQIDIISWGYTVSDKDAYGILVTCGHVKGLTEEIEKKNEENKNELTGLFCKAKGNDSYIPHITRSVRQYM